MRRYSPPPAASPRPGGPSTPIESATSASEALGGASGGGCEAVAAETSSPAHAGPQLRRLSADGAALHQFVPFGARRSGGARVRAPRWVRPLARYPRSEISKSPADVAAASAAAVAVSPKVASRILQAAAMGTLKMADARERASVRHTFHSMREVMGVCCMRGTRRLSVRLCAFVHATACMHVLRVCVSVPTRLLLTSPSRGQRKRRPH